MPELLSTLQKVKDEIQVKINFKKKQLTLETYFIKDLETYHMYLVSN